MLPTTLVGSYTQPDWLIDKKALLGRFPPRVPAPELWRVDPAFLKEAQDDATILAIRDQERAGLDIVTDGEIRRESYSNRFANALEGVDVKNPGTALDRSGEPVRVPRVVGPIRRKEPILVEDALFLLKNTDRTTKMTIPGPFTMGQQAQDEHYGDPEKLAMAYAEAVHEEVRDLFKAGIAIVQLDEPYLQARPEAARNFGIKAINAALMGLDGTIAVHVCFGYAALIHKRPSAYAILPDMRTCHCHEISIETAQSNLDCAVLEELPNHKIHLGVLDLSTHEVETPETVAARIRRALPHIAAERLVIAPDCGLKYLPRDVAFAKMQAMVKGTEIVRRELASSGARTGR